MSDPLERLRGPSPVDVPSVSAIKSRARTIQRRRYIAVSSAAVIVLVVAGVGLFVRPKPVRHQTTSGTSSLAAAPVAPSAAPTAATERASKSAGGFSASQAQRDNASSALAAAPSGQLVVSVQVAAPKFTLSACNGGSSDVTRTFPDSQRYDFEVSRNGALVWRWSDGQAFSQIVGSETWKPHECKTWSATWDEQGAASGSYSLVGVLTSRPEIRTNPASFCVGTC